MEYHLFIDESGDPSLSSINADFPVFALVGCLFENKDYQMICKRISALKLELLGSENAILHSRDIRKCEGVFQKLFDEKVKKMFYENLNRIIAESKFAITCVVINKKEFIEKYGKLADDPYELSLSFLLERAVMETDGENENILDVMLESRGDKEDRILQKRYNELLDRGSRNITPNRFKKRIRKMSFKKKKDNDCGLQISDLCAYPIARHVLNPKEPYPAYDIVEKKLRKGNTGEIMGYGLKIFP